jgi:hypothetical protein
MSSFHVKEDLYIFGQQIFAVYRAGGLAWLGYRLDMAGVKGSTPFRPTILFYHSLMNTNVRRQ